MARSIHNSKRRGFTLVELLVVIAIIASLLGLLLPAVQSAREAARRTQCMTNIRSLAQATSVYESARLKFPAALDRDYGMTVTKAGASGTAAAYSFIFNLLPYLEDKTMYDNVSANTGRMSQGPFSASALIGSSSTGQQVATVTNLAYVQCPSSALTTSVDPEVWVNGARPTSPTSATDVVVSTTNAARSAYHAMVGVAMVTGSVNPSSGAGAIVLTPPAGGSPFGLAGISAGQVSDGLTKTIFYIESRERTYSAWADGCTTWVTALPGQSAAPTMTNGRWTNTTSAHNQTGFMTSAQAGGRIANARDWGPSSEHAGGIVVSVFGDNHVQPITGDVDPSVFAAWATRGGNESNGGVTQ
ncbi:MAG: DUF1559 domain-containing protein [Planctomycetaceae bacterium]